MTARRRAPGTAIALGSVALLMAASACAARSGPSDALQSLDELPAPMTAVSSTTATAPSTTVSDTKQRCDEEALATKSYAPDPLPPVGDMTPGTTMREIADRGSLRVGVDENTLGLSSRNPTTGQIEGFEVDLAYEIAQRIFGERDPALVDLVPVVTRNKTDIVAKGDVDLSINAITMTCPRWEDVAFSAEYYTADQQLLVREDSDIRTVDDLSGRRVCVTAGSSSFDMMVERVPEATLLPVRARTECLLALQNGEADAYFGHDSFLYGMKPQDQTVEIREGIIPGDTTSHYGIAISHDHPELVRFVNAVLEEIRADGTWAALHDRLETELPGLPDATPPEPQYRG
jgi:polar amino acid transport system substrate-binding protein